MDSKIDELQLGTGALPDKPDARDFEYQPIFGAPELEPVNWEKGHDAHEPLNIEPIKQDQNGSSSCVGQGTKGLTRRVLVALGFDDVELSARDVYSHIFLSSGGAYLRDGISHPATVGILPEKLAPDYDNGRAPSEDFMRVNPRTSQQLKDIAKSLDKFSYRMIPLGSGIDSYAHAVQNFHGCLGGFTGTNEGWSKPVIEIPKTGQKRWGHAVDICAYGKLDVAVGKYPVGTKCVFTKNSWGDRYAIKEGRWKGYQGIPEEYFEAFEYISGEKADGIFVFNSWVLVPDEALPTNQKIMDFLKKNQNRVVQVTEVPKEPNGTVTEENKKFDGKFTGIVVGEELRTVDIVKPTEGEKLILTTLVRNGFGTGVTKEFYDQLPKRPL